MSYHVPVLYEESLDNLNIKRDGIYFDGTLEACCVYIKKRP